MSVAQAQKFVATSLHVELDSIAVHHALLVVERLALSLLISINICWPYNAMSTLNGTGLLRLRKRVCKIYHIQQTKL